MSDRQDRMLRITGYSDRLSVRPGETITFYVHSEENEAYEAQIVRLIHGDTNPEGPGFKEEPVEAAVNGTYPGAHQRIDAGSYIVVPHDTRLAVESFTLCAYVYPTLPALGMQGLLTKWNEADGTGYGLFVDENATLCLRIGRGAGAEERVSSDRPLFRNVWYQVSAAYDADSGRVRLVQRPWATPANGGFGMSLIHPLEDTAAEVETSITPSAPAPNTCPFLIAASVAEPDSGRTIFGGHFAGLAEPWPIPIHTHKFNGRLDRPKLANRALTQTEIDALLAGAGVDHLPLTARDPVVGAWDFSANIRDNAASTEIVDTGPFALHGRGVNMPIRAMPGFNWTSDYMSYRHGRDEYGAIHFHDESVDDARWEPAFTFTVPDDQKSGVYAARLRIGGIKSPETEDYLPFFVRPPASGPTARIALVMSTVSYLAYANDNLGVTSPVAQLLTARAPMLQPSDLLLNKKEAYGLGTYSTFRDGWGVTVSSALRPVLNMRPKYSHLFSPSVWQFNADLHLVDWLEAMGYAVDIHTEEDVHREGVGLLGQYRVVLTAHHPEYVSERIMDAYQEYQLRGGRWLYLAANGFYWVTEFHPDNPNLVEVRKGDQGSRAWTGMPGEYCNAFDGKHGGAWRIRGRPMANLLGVSFTSFGLTQSSYYRRAPDSERDECAWIFEGVGRDEPIGDFGLIGGGAAGLELDRADLELGTPHRAFLLAHSEGHSDIFVPVTEEITYSSRGQLLTGTGETNPKIRADMVYFKTPQEGAVFSVGSMAWCGSLSYNGYDNNVSRITRNVIDGFLRGGPLP